MMSVWYSKQMKYFFHWLLVWWRLLGRKQMSGINICVAVRNDATVDVDMSSDYDDDWKFNNLSIEEGEFLIEELTHALTRARARKTVLDARTPPNTSDDKPTP